MPGWLASVPGGTHLLATRRKSPKSAITAAVSAGPDAGGSVTIAGKTYAKARVRLDVGADGSSDATARANAQGLFQFTTTVGTGTTPLRLTATAPGKKAATTILGVNRPAPPVAGGADSTAPKIVLGGGAPASPSRSEVTVTGAVSDAGTGVDSLRAVVDGGATAAVAVGASGNFAFTTVLPLGGTADGPHQVELIATDRAGNSARSPSIPFVLDTQPPVITVSAPAEGAFETGNVVVSGRVDDRTSAPSSLGIDVEAAPPSRSPSWRTGASPSPRPCR